jgi:hypothetical protein
MRSTALNVAISASGARWWLIDPIPLGDGALYRAALTGREEALQRLNCKIEPQFSDIERMRHERPRQTRKGPACRRGPLA